MTITQPEKQLARLADGHGSRTLAAPSLTTSWLGLSQHADADAVTFQLRIPGYRRRDVSIELRDRLLIVRGERTDGWFKRRSKKSFLHTLKLPEELDEHDVCASFAGEVLQLKVARKPYARRRLIPIHAPEAAQPAPKRTTDVTPSKRMSGWFHDLSRGMSALLALNAAGQRGS
jgi:HSP20 family protein